MQFDTDTPTLNVTPEAEAAWGADVIDLFRQSETMRFQTAGAERGEFLTGRVVAVNARFVTVDDYGTNIVVNIDHVISMHSGDARTAIASSWA